MAKTELVQRMLIIPNFKYLLAQNKNANAKQNSSKNFKLLGSL